MQNVIFIAVLVAIVLVTFVAQRPLFRERKRRLSRYWMRNCTGREWRTRFPDVPKDEIRRYLEAFVDGFAFKSNQRLKFSPDDRIMDVYRSLYPSKDMADALEIVFLAKNLKREYNFDLSGVTNSEVTLGELYEMIRNPNKSVEPTRATEGARGSP